MFKWNEVKGVNSHPKHENPVLLSVVFGKDGLTEKTVIMGHYEDEYSCWTFDSDYSKSIVVAWAEFPDPYSEN